MRIEAYNQIQSVYQTQKPRQTQKTAASAYASDKVSISSFGADMAAAKAAVKNASDVRTEITEPLKAQIQNGTYNVPVESFADKLFAKYQEMG